VWVDFENTPHVLFLEPIIRSLRQSGIEVRITAKPQSQTLELAAARGIDVQRVGGGDFSKRWQKITGGGLRALRLAAWAGRGGRPRLLISSSMSAGPAAWLLRVPSVALLDYEHKAVRPLALGAKAVWLPDVLRGTPLPRGAARVARYFPGLKENLYLDSWTFDRDAERRRLGVEQSEYLVVARPPASTAHYAVEQSDRMWRTAMRTVLRWPNVRILISPRNQAQAAELSRDQQTDRLRIIEAMIPGPGLVCAADLVLGGGGTMNREAAVLGVPVWSSFCGPTAHIAEGFAGEGRLRWLRTEADLEAVAHEGPPARGTGRGPAPSGIHRILEDLMTRLELRQTPIS